MTKPPIVRPMSNYEKCICYLANSNAEIIKLNGVYLGEFPFLCFAGCFPELVKNGMVEQVENWPVIVYKLNRLGMKTAFETWKAHGYHPFYPIPGIVSIEEKEAKW
jgi:hypothetical protein